MEDMTLAFENEIQKIQHELVSEGVAYKVGDFFVKAEEGIDCFEVALYDSNLYQQSGKSYEDVSNVTEALNKFCTDYEFTGLDTLENRTADMLDISLFMQNLEEADIIHDQSVEKISEWFNNPEDSIALYSLNDTAFNEQLIGKEMEVHEEFGGVDRRNYHTTFVGNLEDISDKQLLVEALHDLKNGNSEKMVALLQDVSLEGFETGIPVGTVVGLKIDEVTSEYFLGESELKNIDFYALPQTFTDKVYQETVNRMYDEMFSHLEDSSMLDVSTLTSDTFLELMGNHENLENIVREVIPILQAKDEIMADMTGLEEIGSETLYRDFTIVKSEVAVVNEVALLTNENQDIFVVADRGEYSRKEVNDNEWIFPEVFTSQEQAMNSFELRVSNLTEMNQEITTEKSEKVEQGVEKTESQTSQSEAIDTSSVVAISSMELLEMMKQDTELAEKVGEAIDFLKIGEMLENNLQENDLRYINELADSLLSTENIGKIATFQLISEALNHTDLHIDDIKMAELSDIRDCIDHGCDMSMLTQRIDIAYKLQDIEIDNSPKAHAEIQSFFEDVIPTDDLERFTELVAKTTAISEDNSREMVFEYLISEIGDGYIKTGDLHFIEPEDIDKAINSHDGILVDREVQLHHVAESKKDTIPQEEIISSEQSSLELAQTDTLENDNTNGEIFYEDMTTAIEEDKLDLYRQSMDENIECATFLKEEIGNQYKDYSLNTQAVLENTIEMFGVERTEMVLANSIQLQDFDGRISRSNKEWASEVEVPTIDNSQRSAFSVDNAGMVDMLATKLQKMELQHNQEKTGMEESNPPRMVADYMITESEVVGDFEIAIGESQEGMFATWTRCISADESNGFQGNWNHGHYHMEDKESAIADFKERIEDFMPTPEKLGDKKEKKTEKEEPKNSVLESLKKIKAETEKSEVPKLPLKDKSDQSL